LGVVELEVEEVKDGVGEIMVERRLSGLYWIPPALAIVGVAPTGPLPEADAVMLLYAWIAALTWLPPVLP